MRLYSGKVPSIADELVRQLSADGDIEIANEEEVRLDLEAVLKEFIRRDRQILEEAKTRMEQRGLSYEALGKMKAGVAKEMGFPPNDEQLPYIVDQLLTMLFHSANVEEIFAEDAVLRKKITATIRRHTNLESELDKEVRSKIKNLDEGTATFEIEYAKVLEQIKKRKGLSRLKNRGCAASVDVMPVPQCENGFTRQRGFVCTDRCTSATKRCTFSMAPTLLLYSSGLECSIRGGRHGMRFGVLTIVLMLVATTAFAQDVEVEVQAEVQAPPPPEQPAEGTVIQVVDQSQVPDPYAQPVAPGYGQQQQVMVQQQQQAPTRRYRVPYEEGMQLPPGANIINRRRIGMIVSGAVMFAVPYLSTALAYSISNDIDGNIGAKILVPAVGPFLQIPDAGSSVAAAFLAFDGLLQTAGLAMFIVGLLPRKYVEYYADANRPGFGIAPRGSGLDLSYRF